MIGCGWRYPDSVFIHIYVYIYTFKHLKCVVCFWLKRVDWSLGWEWNDGKVEGGGIQWGVKVLNNKSVDYSMKRIYRNRLRKMYEYHLIIKVCWRSPDWSTICIKRLQGKGHRKVVMSFVSCCWGYFLMWGLKEIFNKIVCLPICYTDPHVMSFFMYSGHHRNVGSFLW